MLTTGIRSEIGVKVFGSDLTVLEGTARRIADVVRTVHGATDVYAEQVTGALYLDIKPNRQAAARYGIDVGDVQLGSSMSMPGMAPMSGGAEITPTGQTGTYRVKANFAINGVWHFTVSWNGPRG